MYTYNLNDIFGNPKYHSYPLVHILLPVYNHQNFLRDSIESVLNQDYPNIKLLILNDGSTQDLSHIFNSYKNNDRVVIFEESNSGLPSSLSKLYRSSFKDSKADFITWHSADNIYHPKAISTLVSYLYLNQTIDIAFSDVKLIDENGLDIIGSSFRVNDQYHNSARLNLNYKYSSINQFNDNFINACFMVRASAQQMLNDFKTEHKGYEDYVKHLQLSLIGEGSYVRTEEVLYSYRLHVNSLTEETKNDNLNLKQKAAVSKIYTLKQQLDTSDEVFQIKSSNSLYKYFGKELISPSKLIKHLAKENSSQISLCTLNKSNFIITKLQDAHHSSHKNLFYISPLKVTPESKNHPISEWYCFGCTKDISALTRSRYRDLGMFTNDQHARGRKKYLLFAPSSNNYKIESYVDLISSNQNSIFILYCGDLLEKKNADQIYLASKLQKNIRIVYEDKISRDNLLFDNRILNTLGSIDFIISSSFFSECTINDYVSENILSAAGLKPLISKDINISKNKIKLLDLPITVNSQELELSKFDALNFNYNQIIEHVCDSFLQQFKVEYLYTHLFGALLASEL